MSYTHVGSGQWRDDKTGKIVNSQTDPGKVKTNSTPRGNTSGANNGAASGGVDPNTAALNSLWGKEGTAGGEALINKLGANGEFLGRVGEQTPGQQEYVDKLKAGLGGYTSPEYQAQREQMMQGVNSQYATATNQLAKAQARGKVYGAAGAAQQANLIQGTENNKNDLEQKLMVQNINEMQNRLNNYGTANMANQNATLERQKVNMGNNASEIATRSEALTGAGGLALTKQQNAIMAQIQKQGLAAIGGAPTQQHTSKPKTVKKNTTKK